MYKIKFVIYQHQHQIQHKSQHQTQLPTPQPIPNPGDQVYEYNYTSGVITVSSGYSLNSNNNCRCLGKYLRKIVRESYSYDYVDLTILLHGGNYTNEIIGKRNER